MVEFCCEDRGDVNCLRGSTSRRILPIQLPSELGFRVMLGVLGESISTLREAQATAAERAPDTRAAMYRNT